MSSSFNQSSSSSSTFPIETPENSLLDQIAGVASGFANNLYDWAGQTFANTSNVTNQAVGNFFQTSAKMLGLSNTLTNQYNNLFAPENAQLVADANSYASPARMAVDMGMAGATQAQAGSDALANSEEALRSFGIDPSAGRYKALDAASRVQNAANIAGAENQQRVADIQTGQALRNKAVDVGATLPAAISNVNNTAIQANTGASNAADANANTGANLYSVPDKYLSTAMQLKLPFSGSQGSSQSSGSSSSSRGDSGGSHSGGGGGGGGGDFGGGGGGGGSPAWMPQHGSGQEDLSGSGGAGGGLPDAASYEMPDTSFSTDQGMWNPNTDPQSGGGVDLSQYGGDPFSQDPSTSGSAGGDMGGYAGDSGAIDMSGGGDFARGGAVPMGRIPPGARPRTPYYSPNYAAGGPVDPSQSPSNGAVTDDVPAQMPNGAGGHLNANEFVIPQDVALWKGQEFFQKMIDQSRKALAMATARPTPTR